MKNFQSTANTKRSTTITTEQVVSTTTAPKTSTSLWSTEPQPQDYGIFKISLSNPFSNAVRSLQEYLVWINLKSFSASEAVAKARKRKVKPEQEHLPCFKGSHGAEKLWHVTQPTKYILVILMVMEEKTCSV